MSTIESAALPRRPRGSCPRYARGFAAPDPARSLLLCAALLGLALVSTGCGPQVRVAAAPGILQPVMLNQVTIDGQPLRGQVAAPYQFTNEKTTAATQSQARYGNVVVTTTTRSHFERRNSETLRYAGALGNGPGWLQQGVRCRIWFFATIGGAINRSWCRIEGQRVYPTAGLPLPPPQVPHAPPAAPPPHAPPPGPVESQAPPVPHTVPDAPPP